jgi:hypothetical protein
MKKILLIVFLLSVLTFFYSCSDEASGCKKSTDCPEGYICKNGKCEKKTTTYTDLDNDGVDDDKDNCPTVSNPDQKDTDKDGQGDMCDNDLDGDGVDNNDDNCIDVYNPDQKDTDKDGKGDACDDDIDGDGIKNNEDNCPMIPNPDQKDTDNNGIGDACEQDSDKDGVTDDVDNCKDTYNPDQKDTDKDGKGDACDDDIDGDGVKNENDNCPEISNPDQKDTDRDGKGDACDDDIDGDGVKNENDNCPEISNPDQKDTDKDGKGDACDDDIDGDGVKNENDNCPEISNPDQKDTDKDGKGDACDSDIDGDGIENGNDNCPYVYNPDQKDTDGDGKGDACETDGDGDGIDDNVDNCPSVYNPNQRDMDRDGKGDACDDDIDGDGVKNDKDNCPYVPNSDQKDTDGDGIGDACDDDTNFKSGGNYDTTCKYKPPRGAFNPVIKWEWNTPQTLPQYNQVMSTPIIINTNDDNKDGKINENDIPDVVFISFYTYAGCGGTCLGPGVLRILSGDNGKELVTSTTSNTLMPASNIAAADIDKDGKVEIVAFKYTTDGPVVFDNQGNIKWHCAQSNLNNCVNYANLHSGINWGGPSIADIDGDGYGEIIIGAAVWQYNGVRRWVGSKGIGDNGVGPLSAVADLDEDGKMEIITGSTVYNYDGTIRWTDIPDPSGTGTLGDGFVALADFDGDKKPEMVVVSKGTIRLQNALTGAIIWGPFDVPASGGKRVGAPTIADFDSDGEPEIGVAGYSGYVVFETNGAVKWLSPTKDKSSHATGSSLFDFENDGYVEVLYNDEEKFRVYDGEGSTKDENNDTYNDGIVLFEEVNTSWTAYENPVVADVDNDGKAEIIICANNYGRETGNPTGIRVFKDKNDNWVHTRRIWNQHTYHIDNINEDGTLPTKESPSWKTHNTYRLNKFAGDIPFAAPDLVATWLAVDMYSCPASFTAWVWIENRGALKVPANIPVALFNGNPQFNGQLLGISYTKYTLNPGDSEKVKFIVNNPPKNIDLYIWVDYDGVNSTKNECNESNNLYKGFDFECTDL